MSSASIERLRSGNWLVRVRRGGRGSKKESAGVYPTKGAALEAAQALQERLPATPRPNKRPIGMGPAPWTQVLEAWGKDRQTVGKHQPEVSAQAVRVAKAMAKELGWTTTADATPSDVARYRDRHGRRGCRSMGYLRAAYRWAGETYGQPYDPAVFVALRPPPSRESVARLLTDEEWQAVEREARRLGQWPLVHCLGTYGWRAITAMRLRVQDVDLANAAVRIQVKRRGQHEHALTPETVKLLRPLLKGRKPEEAVFRAPWGEPWLQGMSADSIVGWYRRNLYRLHRGAGGTYALKRRAISVMDELGFSLKDIATITGHATETQVARYLRTNLKRSRAFVAKLAGHRAGHRRGPAGGKRGNAALSVPRGTPEIPRDPDFSVTYA